MGEFNKIFKELRLKNGYTQDGLAEALELSRSSVSMYENGHREPDFDILEKIADFFRVDIDYLIGHSVEQVINEDEKKIEPSYADVELLIARNGKMMSKEQKLRLIQLLSELD